MEEWLKQNEILFKRDIQIIGEYVLDSDEVFQSFLSSPLKDKYMIFVEKYLEWRLYQQASIYKERDGERVLRFLKMYAKPGLIKDTVNYYYNTVYQSLLKTGENSLDKLPILKEIEKIYEAQNLELDDFLDEFAPNQFINAIALHHEQKIKSKETLNIRELQGMLHFYTSECPARLDYKKSKRLLVAIAQLPIEDQIILDGVGIEQVIEKILSSVSKHLLPECEPCFVDNKEMEQNIKLYGNNAFPSAKGLFVYVDNTSKIFLNKDVFLKYEFTRMLELISTFIHECEHAKQKKNKHKDLKKYNHALELEDTLINGTGADAQYYTTNYKYIRFELSAEQVAWETYRKIIQKYLPVLQDFIEPTCQRNLEQIEKDILVKDRLYMGTIQPLEVIFQKIMKETSGKALRNYPELQREYAFDGRRKQTWELLEEKETAPTAEEKSCYEALILERDLPLDFLMEDYIYFILNTKTKDFSYFKEIIDSYYVRFQKTAQLDFINKNEKERKRV